MEEIPITLNRRTFLRRSVFGAGTLALASLLDPLLLSSAEAAEGGVKAGAGLKRAGERWSGVVHPLPYKQKIKRVIHLYMAGGPSHLETFDPKPKLAEMSGKPMPES